MPDTAQGTAIYPPSTEMAQNAHIDAPRYDALYAESISDPEGFWRREAGRIDWIKPFTKVKDVDYSFGNVSIKWFEDGTL
ncbi:MAG: acetyl-coenzyme A synthetase N-terminal domain-containing protein, partial [Roseobacter sp.]